MKYLIILLALALSGCALFEDTIPELEAEIAELQAEAEAEVEKLKAEAEAEIEELRAEIEERRAE
jgi:Tfp pilus assembly protein PilP